MRRGLVAGALLALTVVVAQGEPPVQAPPLDDRFWPMVRDNLADPLALKPDGGNLGQNLSMVGREDLADLRPQSYLRKTCQPLMKDGVAVEPVAYIAARAAMAQVTMISEAHDMPQTRAFIMKVAAVLRGEGYAGYGAETFNMQIGRYEPAWPQIEDGWYSREPVYGRLIRQLRRQKYRLLNYEFIPLADTKGSFEQQADEREMGEASNLMTQQASLQRSLGDGAKILVHVGYGHLTEKSAEGHAVQMGQRFKDASGIDPLTIDQTVFFSPTDSYVVCDPDALGLKVPGVDIYLGMPKLRFERSRPTYRLALGDRFVDIPDELRRTDQIAVYDARPVGEPLNSVPMDRILLRPGETLPLLLPPGRYDVSVWTEKEGWSPVAPLTVAAH
jgi:hypothetical protein